MYCCVIRLVQELSGTPNPWYFLKSIASTNGRGAAVQIGCVLQCKLEVYCGVPFLQSLEASEAQRYKWGAYCVQIKGAPPVLIRHVVRVGGSWTVPIGVCVCATVHVSHCKRSDRLPRRSSGPPWHWCLLALFSASASVSCPHRALIFVVFLSSVPQKGLCTQNFAFSKSQFHSKAILRSSSGMQHHSKKLGWKGALPADSKPSWPLAQEMHIAN